MTRSVLWMLVMVLMLALAPASLADDEKQDEGAALTPAQVARIILTGDGPQNAFIAQYLERADQATILEIQAALRELAPAMVDRNRARGPLPSTTAQTSDPTHVITMEVRILESDKPGSFREFISDIAVDDHESSVVMLDDTQVEVIFRGVEKRADVRQLTAPRLTTYDRQRANISIVNQISFIQDYDVEVFEDAQVVDPIIGVVQEGLVLEVLPTLSEDKRFVTIELDATWAEIGKPISERELLIGGQKVKIQLPEISVGNSHVTATLAAGGTMLVQDILSVGGVDVDRVAIVTAHIVTLSEGFLKDMRDEAEKAVDDAEKRAGKDDETPGVRVKKK